MTAEIIIDLNNDGLGPWDITIPQHLHGKKVYAYIKELNWTFSLQNLETLGFSAINYSNQGITSYTTQIPDVKVDYLSRSVVPFSYVCLHAVDLPSTYFFSKYGAPTDYLVVCSPQTPLDSVQVNTISRSVSYCYKTETPENFILLAQPTFKIRQSQGLSGFSIIGSGFTSTPLIKNTVVSEDNKLNWTVVNGKIVISLFIDEN